MKGYTVFFTYMLSNSGATGYGYSDAIHCNYINSTQIDTVVNKEVNLYFDNINDFKYLSVGDATGTGYTVNKIFIIAQIINNTPYSAIDKVKPQSNSWKKIDVTSQVRNRPSGSTSNLSAVDLVSTVFKVGIADYNSAPSYNLEYLSYPSLLSTGTTSMKFGDEEYFLGNVVTDIEALAYTTDLAINLPLDQFNSSTNATWEGISSVYISEVAIYDEEKNLVAIGKLNDPVPKDANISRTIAFAIDF